MTPELVVVVPTRSRPFHVKRVVEAWRSTDAFADGAELHFAIDGDDPAYDAYVEQLDAVRDWSPAARREVTWSMRAAWAPLVPKLNAAAVSLLAPFPAPYALGFAGDDHLPRTRGWVRRYLDALRAGAGIVYCDDGYQHDNIPTQWAMRADYVRVLGRMVPAPVAHLYCDNAMKDLGEATGSLAYLPDVMIEHMHPVARDAAGQPKAPTDEQYDRVNSRSQYAEDHVAYRQWRRRGLAGDASLINDLRMGESA
jgi:hypothetical protein